jgi:rhamnogalacturonan acetylesterase
MLKALTYPHPDTYTTPTMKVSPFVFKRWWQLGAALLISVTPASAQTAANAQASTPATVPTTAASPAEIPTIFVCGDSTARNNDKTKTDPPVQMMGWGNPIADYFDLHKVRIDNVAHAGTSSHTYYNGDWPRVLPQIKPGDYVLEVFGINDGSTPNGLGDETKDVPNPRTGKTDSIHTYGWYMSKMATDAQAKGAHVYLLTVTTRDIWTNPKARFQDAKIVSQDDGYSTADDKIERGTGNGKYTQWTKDVGAKLNIPVLDLTNLEADRYEKMGREKVMVNYTDHNHTNTTGADIVASIIVSGLKAFKDSPFVPMLSAKGKAVETADAKYVEDNLPTDAQTAPAATAATDK